VVVFDEDRIHDSALRIISIRPHSTAELRRKLLKKAGDPAAVDRVIERLSRVELLNDDRFARDFIEYGFVRKSWGKRKVWAGLMKRGIDRTIIDELLRSPDAALMEQEGARRFVDREIRDGDTSEEHIKKIAGKLVSRGFGWDVVSQVIKSAGQLVPEHESA
jgi:regulatory protein